MTARAEAVRANTARVLDVAVALFADKPYDDVTLEQIAARSGITKRTVMRQFGSKEQLFVTGMARAGGVDGAPARCGTHR